MSHMDSAFFKMMKELSSCYKLIESLPKNLKQYQIHFPEVNGEYIYDLYQQVVSILQTMTLSKFASYDENGRATHLDTYPHSVLIPTLITSSGCMYVMNHNPKFSLIRILEGETPCEVCVCDYTINICSDHPVTAEGWIKITNVLEDIISDNYEIDLVGHYNQLKFPNTFTLTAAIWCSKIEKEDDMDKPLKISSDK